MYSKFKYFCYLIVENSSWYRNNRFPDSIILTSHLHIVAQYWMSCISVCPIYGSFNVAIILSILSEIRINVMTLVVQHELHAVFCGLAFHAPQAIATFREHINMAILQFRQYLVTTSIVVKAFYLVVSNLYFGRRYDTSNRNCSIIAPVANGASKTNFRDYAPDCI